MLAATLAMLQQCCGLLCFVLTDKHMHARDWPRYSWEEFIYMCIQLVAQCQTNAKGVTDLQTVLCTITDGLVKSGTGDLELAW